MKDERDQFRRHVEQLEASLVDVTKECRAQQASNSLLNDRLVFLEESLKMQEERFVREITAENRKALAEMADRSALLAVQEKLVVAERNVSVLFAR